MFINKERRIFRFSQLLTKGENIKEKLRHNKEWLIKADHCFSDFEMNPE